jgi:hypothetical protein
MRSGWLALFAIVLAYACGGKTDSEPALCEPGTELTCPPPCLGVSTCATDGSGWSSCCGSGGSGYGGSGGAVGSGGAGSGGVAGNGGNAGSGGSGGGVMCESTYCGDYHLAGFVLPGCCPGYNSCGASIAPEVSEALSLPTGCIDTEQSGNNDASCPGLSYVDPFDGQKKEYPGCCRGGSTTCGVKVDFVLDLGSAASTLAPPRARSVALRRAWIAFSRNVRTRSRLVFPRLRAARSPPARSGVKTKPAWIRVCSRTPATRTCSISSSTAPTWNARARALGSLAESGVSRIVEPWRSGLDSGK